MPLKCRNNGVKKELIKSLPSPFFSQWNSAFGAATVISYSQKCKQNISEIPKHILWSQFLNHLSMLLTC